VTFVPTEVGGMGDTNNRSAYTCELIMSPTANALLLAGVLVSDAAGTPVEPTGVVGAGLTFSLVTSSVTFDPTTVGSEIHNISLWRAMGPAPDSSVVTATFPNAATGCVIQVHQVSGCSTKGNNGESAVGGSATSRVNNSSSITLFPPSGGSTANGWFSIHGAGTTGTATPMQGWTSLGGEGYLTPSTGMFSAWTERSDGTVLQWMSAQPEWRGAVIVELVADNPADVAPAQWAQGMIGRGVRAFAPRLRSEYWVERGHVVSENPATDTREV
jgi:hypothetical protein